MPHLPVRDRRAGTAMERADSQCVAGRPPAVQRALRARKGTRGQGALGAAEESGSAGAAGASGRCRTAGARELRPDPNGARVWGTRPGDRALGAGVGARGTTTEAVTTTMTDWSVREVQVGIDSFAAAYLDESRAESPSDRVRQLVEQIELADQVGLDVFGIGEHHRKDYLDSAPPIILAAAATRTQRIRLTSAVTVLSAADPVRVFLNFATLDLLSQGRAEMVVGRGSFIDAFPLFGLSLQDYDALFEDKLDLLLKVRDNEHVHWTGRFRPDLTGQGVYPRPVQNPLPVWLGVGGTPKSFARAGALGLPLMVAIIGRELRRFRPLIDLYREMGKRSGYSPDRLKVGVHA